EGFFLDEGAGRGLLRVPRPVLSLYAARGADGAASAGGCSASGGLVHTFHPMAEQRNPARGGSVAGARNRSAGRRDRDVAAAQGSRRRPGALAGSRAVELPRGRRTGACEVRDRLRWPHRVLDLRPFGPGRCLPEGPWTRTEW